MALSVKFVVLMYIFTAGSWIRYVSSSSTSVSTCCRHSNTFLHDLKFQCPREIPLSSPIEMDGESLDKASSASQMNVYTSVLFYASWCPFSSGVRPKFTALSTMFPQIKHLMVEQSSTMPSVFSRYGIHSLPSILIVNPTKRVRYHGPKDLSSLVQFYKRTTGLDPVVDLTKDQIIYSESGQKALQSWNGTSLKEILMREPSLVLSVAFLLLRAIFYFFPEIVARVVALWFSYVPHLNLGIFGDSRQILGRVLHMFDVERIWSKLKLGKIRNFHKGARSARVWASSLASVSLGETSSTRASSPSADL